jgi:hypothetical protein
MVSEITAHRRAFFAFLAEELPALDARMTRGNEHSRWLAVGPMPLIAVHYVANGGVGLFKRGARRTRSGLIREYLFPHREFLAAALRRSITRLPENFLLGTSLRIDMLDRANWPRGSLGSSNNRLSTSGRWQNCNAGNTNSADCRKHDVCATARACAGFPRQSAANSDAGLDGTSILHNVMSFRSAHGRLRRR